MIRNTLSRRTFIGGAAVGAGLLVLPIRVFGANARLNVGCIGAGGKGGSDVSGVAGAGANIVALCDVDKKRAESGKRRGQRGTQPHLRSLWGRLRRPTTWHRIRD